MVESYSKNANHNMRRPVVKDEIVEFMRHRQEQVTGSLKELENFARKENIPIIPHETVAYFRFLMETIQPKNILEIWNGNWIFSSFNGKSCSKCKNNNH